MGNDKLLNFIFVGTILILFIFGEIMIDFFRTSLVEFIIALSLLAYLILTFKFYRSNYNQNRFITAAKIFNIIGLISMIYVQIYSLFGEPTFAYGALFL